ncbi:MAG TPA: hypothetical protein DD457_07555 [Gammaproteobacteria bacterium]|uniref:UGSC-like domain-containing protein n=1 Tax=marine metagenome TaxID=408172 RepID=A0A381T0W9_9ZZZZ|nr:hypothetical protein [Gammaproteobacteria bacterium]HBP15043.1 hypothetical protein [Gammaproteobacteria bacterium]|tara:strand:- start:501 stop:779 length:279 start_codon:yes stop_codon:yes gene_type:complete
MTTILDPTDERVPIERSVTERPTEISGTLALLDIAKPRGNVLLDRLEAKLQERLPSIKINRYTKPTFTKPAPEPLRQEIKASNDFVVEALAD